MTTKKKKILSDAEVEGGLKVGGTLNIPIQNGLLATNNSGDVAADTSIDLDELHTLDGIDKTQTIQTQLTNLGTRITNLDDAAVHKAGTETITGAKTFTADTVMSGNVTVGAAGSPSKDLHVLGNADVDGYLNVDGNETLNGVLDVPTIKNSRTVSNVDQPLTLDDDVTITSGKTLKVSSITGTTSDELNINTPVNVIGDLSTTTDVTAGRDLAVTRNASVTGVLTAPTLHTQHISDPDDDVVEIDDTLNVNGNLNVVGASSDLSVGRNASITGTLYTDKIASKTENDLVNVNDNLTVAGTTTSTGLVTANDGLTVNGASTLNGNISQSTPSSGSRTASLQDTTVKSLNITGSTANSILRTDGSKNVSATTIDGTADKVLTTGSGNTLTWQLPTTTSSPTENSNAVASVGSVYLEKTRAETAEGALSDRVGTLESETVNDGGTYLTKADRTLNHDATSRDSTSDTSVLTNGGTVTFIDSLTSNQTGHVTASNTKTATLPKVVAGTGITVTDGDLPSPATGKGITVGHTNSIAVNSSDVGNATTVPIIRNDAQGHLTKVSSTPIDIPTSQVTSLGGYSVQSGYSALGTSDTLNVALGKLEKALTDGSVTKVGKTTVGSTVKPIYLNNGTPAVLGSVGASAKPVYLDQGEIKASTSSIGNATTPVYLSSGTITAGTALHDAAYLDKVTTIPTSGQTTDNDVPTTNAVKQFVNSSIGTATANFLGTYTALEYRLEPAYLTFTSTSDYVDYYVVYNSTYTLVTTFNKDSLGITAGTTKAYSQPMDSLGFTQAQVDEMTDPYSTESGAIATELGQIISNPSPNDYVFVEMDFTDPATSPDEYRRYKFDGSVWQYEYTLNNSSFTQAQWDAINSGINTTLVTKLNGIEAGAEVNVQSDWSQIDTAADDYIKNKPNLATVATSGSYSDLSNTPTIGLADLKVQANSTDVSTFSANATSAVTLNIKSGTAATVARTAADEITISSPELSLVTSPNGTSNDIVTDVSVSGHQVTQTKGYKMVTGWGTSNANATDSNIASAKLTKDTLDAKLDNSQLVTSWQSTVSDTNIPSEKLVKDTLDTKVTNNSTYGGLAITGETTANNSADHAVAINGTVSQNANYAIAMGHGSFVSAYSQGSIAIGLFAQIPSTSTGYAIQLGRGSNTEHDTFKVGFQEGYNYKLLDGITGKIPVDRLTIDATPTASSTNPVTSDGVKTALDTKVAGPSSSADGNVALFDGTTGKLIKDSGKTLGASIPTPTASQDEGKAIIVNSTGTGFEFGEAEKVDDIKVNNTSIVSSKEANIITGAGLTSSSNTIKTKLSSESSIGTIGNNRVYAVGVDSNGKLAVNVPWVDTAVFQEAVSTNVERPLMLGYRIGTNPISDSVNGPLFKTTSITANPSTGTITATGFVGNVTGNCSGSAGSVAYANITSNPFGVTDVTITEVD